MMDLLEDRYKRTSPSTAFCFFIIYLEIEIWKKQQGGIQGIAECVTWTHL